MEEWKAWRPIFYSSSLPILTILTLLTLLILLTLSYIPLSAASASDAELGKRIYREGILPSGKPIRATLLGGITIEGTQFNCASCYRRSGFGSGKGAAFVLPVIDP